MVELGETDGGADAAVPLRAVTSLDAGTLTAGDGMLLRVEREARAAEADDQPLGGVALLRQVAAPPAHSAERVRFALMIGLNSHLQAIMSPSSAASTPAAGSLDRHFEVQTCRFQLPNHPQTDFTKFSRGER